MSIRKPLVAIIVAIMLLAAGVFIGLLICQYNWFEFSLTAGNILQSLTTVFSACVVAVYLQKMTGDYRKQKELFLAQLDEVVELLKEVDDVRIAGRGEFTKVAAILKKLRMKNRLIRECMKESEVRLDVIKACDLSETLQKLTDACTDTPRKSRDDTELDDRRTHVIDGVIVWSFETANEIDATISRCKTTIFKAQLLVNLS